MKTWRDILLDFLNWIRPPEQPTREERARYDAEMKERQKILIDPRPYQVPVYEPPSPTTNTATRQLQTDPRFLSMRQRAAMHQTYHEAGDFMRHVKETERKRFITRQLNPTVTTHELPKMPRELKMMSLEDEWQPGDTLHRTPTFLEDQGRKTG